ncbi:MAG TPA: hypothetical protein VLO11_11515, partial [Luteolibacter sp.]|nr:hypothetical protein [Luteolibacter sp.]
MKRHHNPAIQRLFADSLFLGALAAFTASAHAASLEVDFQATIASQEHPIGNPAGGEGRYYNVSVNAANPGTGAYRATIPGTNDPAPPFVRNYDGPVYAYKFTGGSNDNINGTDATGGNFGSIVFTSTDSTMNRFGQQQGRLWTSNDPGSDLQVSIADPVNGTTGSAGGKGGWRFLNDCTGTIDVSAIPGGAGSIHIYYGDYNATPTLSVVMRDTDGIEPDLTIAEAHLNGDAANNCEYYLAEIDFVTDGVYDEVEFVWTSGTGDGRFGAVVVTEAVADAVDPTLAPADIVDNRGGGPIDTDGNPVIYTVTYSEFMDPATIGADDFEVIATGTAGGTIESVVHYGKVTTVNFLPTEGTDGTIQLQVKAGAVLADLAGNELDPTTAIADDNIITVNPDTTPPTVASFDRPTPNGTIYGLPTITYTVTFSEPISTALDATNFTNGGTAAATIGTVTDISPGGLEPSVYTVELIPSGTGTLQLEVQGTIEDGAGNALVVPVTDAKVFTIDTGTEPARETVTLDAFTTSNSSANPHDLVFDASASDKLVV